MPSIAAHLLPKHRLLYVSASVTFLRGAHWKPKPQKPSKPPPPPTPPKPPEKPVPFTFHGDTWHDPYSWMSDLADKVAMRHMDVYMEQEEKYIEAVMSGSDRLQHKLQAEMGSRLAYYPSSPPVRWGPWYVILPLLRGQSSNFISSSLGRADSARHRVEGLKVIFIWVTIHMSIRIWVLNAST